MFAVRACEKFNKKQLSSQIIRDVRYIYCIVSTFLDTCTCIHIQHIVAGVEAVPQRWQNESGECGRERHTLVAYSVSVRVHGAGEI